MLEILASLMFTIVMPQWTEVMGHINCTNAEREHHIVRESCETTICEYPDGELLVFVQCGVSQVQCVAFEAKESCYYYEAIAY